MDQEKLTAGIVRGGVYSRCEIDIIPEVFVGGIIETFEKWEQIKIINPRQFVVVNPGLVLNYQ